jgi:prepilin-type N-terminal cleavage/methylation domain-containing protein
MIFCNAVSYLKKIIKSENPDKKDKAKAFTLLELSLVVLIISVLISGGLSVSITAINNSKMRITKERVNQIYRAMGNYLMINKKLPCPASLAEVKTSVEYGNEGFCSETSTTGIYVSSGAPLLNYGAVPVTSLGLPKEMAEDGFGNKLVYVVDRTFAAEDGYAYNKYGSITIMENQGGSNQTIVPTSAISGGLDKAVLVIMSHGQNQFGSFSAASSSINAASTTDANELENVVGSTSAPDFDYVFFAESKNSDSFDDYVFYKTRNNILVDFNAMSLIKCVAASTNGSDVANCEGGTCVWPDAYYGQIAVSTTPCASTHLTTVAYPTKRCLSYGAWQAGAINPCTN